MDMRSCYTCGKIFGTSSGTVCPSCRKLLDLVYEKARAYLRDHPKEKLDAMQLAKAIGEDERHIELLMLEGRFNADDSGEPESSDAEKIRKRLLDDFQKSLGSSAKKSESKTTYGADRYGRSAKDK